MSNFRSVDADFDAIKSGAATSVDARRSFVIQSRSPFLYAPAVSGDSCHELLRD
jgi:hypothetical protein